MRKMIIVCGAACQGKRDWAAAKWEIPAESILDGREYEKWADALAGPGPEPRSSKAVLPEKGGQGEPDSHQLCLLDHFESMVWHVLQRGGDPGAAARALMDRCPDLILITDEIGSGIIPMDEDLRDYREVHGRVCCDLAAAAQEVYRVSCGIGVRIKP